ncbi:hypothetical protein ACN28E_32240 [Archangium lansingense]|uniref:hypothetical protein n=1 Tax=Archangium lansingense TaxID=2995310 RepID=UPI003B782C73
MSFLSLYHIGEPVLERVLQAMLEKTISEVPVYAYHEGQYITHSDLKLASAIRALLCWEPGQRLRARFKAPLTHPQVLDAETTVDCAILNEDTMRAFPIELKSGNTGQGASWKEFMKHNFQPNHLVGVGKNGRLTGRVPAFLSRCSQDGVDLSKLRIEDRYEFQEWGLCVRRGFKFTLNGNMLADKAMPLVFFFEDVVNRTLTREEFDRICTEIVTPSCGSYHRQFGLGDPGKSPASKPS